MSQWRRVAARVRPCTLRPTCVPLPGAALTPVLTRALLSARQVLLLTGEADLPQLKNRLALVMDHDRHVVHAVPSQQPASLPAGCQPAA